MDPDAHGRALLGNPFEPSAATSPNRFLSAAKVASQHPYRPPKFIVFILNSLSHALFHVSLPDPAEERQHQRGRPLSFPFAAARIVPTATTTALTLFPTRLRLRACPKFLLTSLHLFGSCPPPALLFVTRYHRSSAHRASAVWDSFWPIIAGPYRSPLGPSLCNHLDFTSQRKPLSRGLARAVLCS